MVLLVSESRMGSVLEKNIDKKSIITVLGHILVNILRAEGFFVSLDPGVESTHFSKQRVKLRKHPN